MPPVQLSLYIEQAVRKVLQEEMLKLGIVKKLTADNKDLSECTDSFQNQVDDLQQQNKLLIAQNESLSTENENL